MNYQNVDKIAIKQLKDLTFKVPSYQRGYRWNTIHVEQFIEDIYEDDNEYCIQPLIVKQADNYYYVIDGQQRLTTIMIMIGALKYLNGGRFQDDVSMSLQYETRAISKSFLDFLVMDESFHCNEAFANDPYEHIKASFELKKSNLDIDYMINTFIVAMTKFKELGTTKAYDELYDRLMNHCKVIWYPIDADESIDIEQDSISEADKHERNLDIEQFSKLNMGKIPLTNAELIKAEFMNPYYFEDQYKHNIQLIAEQWYHMEISLHNPDFWAFIPHEEQYGNDHHSLTRLDEIFEFLLIRKYKQLQDGKSYEEAYREEMLQRFYLYNQMNEWIKASGANRTGIFERWEEVREAFESIKELYEHDGRKQSYEPGQVKKNKIPIGLYNFVGYFLYISRYVLQHSKYAVWEELDDIMTQDRSNRLHVIKQKIWLKVKEMLSIQEIGKLKNKLEELKYEAGNETNNNKIRGVLLLYNIILMSNNSGIGNRYDFLRFNRWTLEHIHAQNEKALVYEEDAIDTINTKINEIEESYNKKLEQIKEQVARIRDLSKREEIIKNETERLERNKAEKKAVEEDKLKRFKSKKEIDYIRREIINELVVYYDSMVGKNTHESFDHFLRISILYEQLDKLEEQGLTKYLANQKDIREILIPNQSETHRNKLVYKLLATENTGSENETEIIKEIKDMIYKSYNFEALIDMLNAKLEFPIVKPPCQELLDLYNGYRSNFDSLTNNDDPPSSLVEKVVVKLTDSFFEHMQEIQKENTNQSLRVFNDYAKRIIASHIEDEIERYFAQEHNELLAVHSINNLTLLRNYENGEIGNEYFINKKKRIQQFLKEGTVIPYSTLLVFLDLYSDIESISTAEKWQWLPRSRDKYFNELVEQITTFFKDENV